VSGSRLILVHGFTQTGRSWASVAPLVGELSGREVLTPDLPGHGASRASRPAGLARAAAAIGESCGRGVWVGYSMGARVCLRLALDRPGHVERLVLVGATPGLADAREREERRAADEALAARLEPMGIGEFLDAWLAGPLFAHLRPEQAGRAARLSNDCEGLAWALRTLGTGAEPSMWDELPQLSMPVLVMAGERDAKFTALANRIAAAIGDNAETASIAQAGHAAPFEQPESFARSIGRWMDGAAPAGSEPAAAPARD
jgi:2-succinyl-6-hydroxy-2,4-cyclohexadiene-1-carboxylate synthase